MCNLSEGIVEYSRTNLLKEMIADKIKAHKSDNEIWDELKKYGVTPELIKKVHDELCSMA